MAFLDSLTGGAYAKARQQNLFTAATGMNQANTALGQAYGSANDVLLNSALPALDRGYASGRQDTINQLGNSVNSIGAGYGSGRDALGALYGRAGDAISGGYDSALGALGSGFGQARSDLLDGYGRARDDLGRQYGETQGYLGRATAAYDPLIDGSRGAFTGYMDASGANGADGSARAQAAFREAPGYRYQMDQALDAIQRTAASRGGLAGGNTTADILRTATGLADQSWQESLNNLYRGASFYQSGLQGRAQGLTNQGLASERYGNALAGVDTGLGDALAQNSRGLGTAQANLYGQKANALGGLYQAQGNALNASHVGEGSALSDLYGGFGSSLAGLDVGLGTGQASIYGRQAGNLTALGNAQSNVIGNATRQMIDANDTNARGQTEASKNFLGTVAGIANSPLTGKIGAKLFSGLFG